jgi:hypothetical protein
MNYVAVEKLLKTQIQAVTGFTNTTDKINVIRGDKWTILNTGSSDHYAIIRKGEHSRQDDTMRIKGTNWRTVIEICQRITSEPHETIVDALLNYMDAITTRLDQYRKLADTNNLLLDSNVTGGGEAKAIWTNKGDLPSWLMVELYVDWSEQTNVTYAE